MPGQWIAYAAAAGLVLLAVVLACFPLEDHPEPERFQEQPEWTGDELAAIRDHIDADRDARNNDYQGRHRAA